MFKTIVADPPWHTTAGRSLGLYLPHATGQRFGVTDNRARPLAYPVLTVEAICAIPVTTVAATNAHLYLWTINRYVEQAFTVARAWGFRYSTLLTWAKRPMGGGLGGDAYGLASEFVLFCRRGTLPAVERIGQNWFNWKRPYVCGHPAHSHKPPEFFAMVERVSPPPRLELFARGQREGWAVWGDEIESNINLDPPVTRTP